MRPLVLAAHGSAHPGHSAVLRWVADRIVGARPDLDVRIGFLGHDEPRLADTATAGAVVVPMLLGSTFHLSTDVPAAAGDAILAEPIGPDPRLAAVLADRLREAGWSAGTPVTLAAAGTAQLDTAARQLADVLGVTVTAAMAGNADADFPALADLEPEAVATYLLGPGHFAEIVAGCGAPVVSAPIGADPRVAEVAMGRYDAALPLF
ncbi:MAG TPA: CbiX/SirB N-terminal domain-containing protein [Mycobacteriales bacterium]|nr:CbiX/SirB N-terminal domain-containing protein [Mycobacteriales bacterium]